MKWAVKQLMNSLLIRQVLYHHLKLKGHLFIHVLMEYLKYGDHHLILQVQNIFPKINKKFRLHLII